MHRLLTGAKVDDETGCWVWMRNRNHKVGGYGLIMFRGKSLMTHRLMYELVSGVAPGEMKVCHRCDNRLCINPDHLFLGTQQENIHDCIRKGRRPADFNCGEKCGRAKLDNDKVREVRRLLSEGVLGAHIAKMFGVRKNAIYEIRDGRSWTHLK